MKLSVYKIDGTESGKQVELDEKVFGITPNDHAIYLDVVQYLANQRQGTSKTKDRSENAHSTKKLGRQKGGGGKHKEDFTVTWFSQVRYLRRWWYHSRT